MLVSFGIKVCFFVRGGRYPLGAGMASGANEEWGGLDVSVDASTKNSLELLPL